MHIPEYQEPKWYCVKSQPRQEHVAAANLGRLDDIDVFCPRIRFKKCTRGGRAAIVTEALFPGYIFANFRLDLEHRKVRYAHGVQGIVHFGKKYASVPNEIIADLRCQIGEESVAEISSALSEGDSVKIIHGAFRGLSAVITQVRPASERVRVLLEFLGRKVEAELSSEFVLSEVQHHPLAAGN